LVGTDLEYPRHKYVPVFGKCGHCTQHEHHWQHSEHDHDFDGVLRSVENLIRRGDTIYQKWTCEHCGSRQTMAEPNKLYYQGVCEECKQTTSIKDNGCNYLLITKSLTDTLAGMGT